MLRMFLPPDSWVLFLRGREGKKREGGGVGKKRSGYNHRKIRELRHQISKL